MFTSLTSRATSRLSQRLVAGFTRENTLLTVSRARMGSASNTPPQEPYKFDPKIQKKFKLDPIPEDGVYREPYKKIYDKPFHHGADAYFIDPIDSQLIFDKNGNTPRLAIRHFIIAFTLVSVPFYFFPRFVLGDDKSPKIAPHQEMLPELISQPTFAKRKLVTDF